MESDGSEFSGGKHGKGSGCLRWGRGCHVLGAVRAETEGSAELAVQLGRDTSVHRPVAGADEAWARDSKRHHMWLERRGGNCRR